MIGLITVGHDHCHHTIVFYLNDPIYTHTASRVHSSTQ